MTDPTLYTRAYEAQRETLKNARDILTDLGMSTSDVDEGISVMDARLAYRAQKLDNSAESAHPAAAKPQTTKGSDLIQAERRGRIVGYIMTGLVYCTHHGREKAGSATSMACRIQNGTALAVTEDEVAIHDRKIIVCTICRAPISPTKGTTDATV